MEKQRRKVKKILGCRVWLQGWALKRFYASEHPSLTEDELSDFIQTRSEAEISADVVTYLLRSLDSASKADVPSNATQIIRSEASSVNSQVSEKPEPTKTLQDALNQMTILDDDD